MPDFISRPEYEDDRKQFYKSISELGRRIEILTDRFDAYMRQHEATTLELSKSITLLNSHTEAIIEIGHRHEKALENHNERITTLEIRHMQENGFNSGIEHLRKTTRNNISTLIAWITGVLAIAQGMYLLFF